MYFYIWLVQEHIHVHKNFIFLIHFWIFFIKIWLNKFHNLISLSYFFLQKYNNLSENSDLHQIHEIILNKVYPAIVSLFYVHQDMTLWQLWVTAATKKGWFVECIQIINPIKFQIIGTLIFQNWPIRSLKSLWWPSCSIKLTKK